MWKSSHLQVWAVTYTTVIARCGRSIRRAEEKTDPKFTRVLTRGRGDDLYHHHHHIGPSLHFPLLSANFWQAALYSWSIWTDWPQSICDKYFVSFQAVGNIHISCDHGPISFILMNECMNELEAKEEERAKGSIVREHSNWSPIETRRDDNVNQY